MNNKIMFTVENRKIRVTVTPEIWREYEERAESVAALSNQNQKTVLRGLILSEAARRLESAVQATFTSEMLDAGIPMYMLVYVETLKIITERWLQTNAPSVWVLSPDERRPYRDAMRSAEIHVHDLIEQTRFNHGNALRRYIEGDKSALPTSGMRPVPIELIEAVDAAIESVQFGQRMADADLARKSLDGWKIEQVSKPD